MGAETKQKFRDFKNNFEKWYFKAHCKSNIKFSDLLPHHKDDVFGWFDRVGLPFKWGVYEDFFEKAGIYPEVKDCKGHEAFTIEGVERYHACCSVRGGKYYPLIFTDSKEKARLKALNKAIELYETIELLKYL